MEPNYVYILDFMLGILNIIHLTPEEIKASENFENFEDFLQTIEDKYDFRVSDCQWMCSEDMDIYRYENGEQIAHINENEISCYSHCDHPDRKTSYQKSHCL